MSGFSKKHTLARRDIINHNGAFIPNLGVFVRSGSLEGVGGSLTGSVEISFDAVALRLRRVETFHSGAAPNFNLAIENSFPNTGSFFDPRNTVTCYTDIPGSNDFSQGIDQVEDIVAITDKESSSCGRLYLKFMPFGSGNNAFKYLLFFEAVVLYVEQDGSLNG